ncbi:MAG: Ig-like domain-containing protein [Chloroflexota bacterium]
MHRSPKARAPFQEPGSKRHVWLPIALFSLFSLFGLAFPAVNTYAYYLPQTDSAPFVTATQPAHQAVNIPPNTALAVTFSEPVSLANGAITLTCSQSGQVLLTASGEPETFALTLSAAGDCLGTAFAHLNSDDPPDMITSDHYRTPRTIDTTALDIVINEVDAITTNSGHELIELYDGGSGHTPLDGLQLAFYNGATDTLYTNYVLNGYQTDADGYFLISSDSAVADLLMARGALLDGPAAVALYAAPGGALPINSPPIVDGLLDAIVYGNGQAADAGLLPLLEANEPQVDEDSRGQATADSNQRCPNGSGGQRRTGTYRQNTPTPGVPNDCATDAAPEVITVEPIAGTEVQPADVALSVTFSEPVTLSPGALKLECDTNGSIPLTVSGGPITYTATPQQTPDWGAACAATVVAQYVSDVDTTDPPDIMVNNRVWTFAVAPKIATHMLINEVDSDTPGQDMAEFIELYDGGDGHTDLSGLVVVLFNGGNDKSYRAIDLDGQATDADGYFVIGNKALNERNLTLPDAGVQNGPDAVAIYAGGTADFPNGTPVTTNNLVDAMVYGSTQDAGLKVLLESGQDPADENGRGDAEIHSNQRCPNGTGGQRKTETFKPNLPTPGSVNVCTSDDAPRVTGTTPANGAQNVALDIELVVEFSEPVQTKSDWGYPELHRQRVACCSG